MRSVVIRSARRRAPVLARRLAACAGAVAGVRSRSFTLIEVLVAVGAVALVAVAIAAVFDQTGRTVTAGRRLSTLTSYAALIEQQMRADFDRMTRNGYLIIRNEVADADRAVGYTIGVDVVPLHAEDTRPRPRRIDEIMFFEEGDFTTGRDPLDPSQVARANAARVYYGHGKRRVVNTVPGFANPYLWPWLGDSNDEPEANLGVADPVNPNRYASDWTLLRLQTVLIPPRTTQINWAGLAGLPGAALLDKDTQIAYQPAASNIFRALAGIFPAGPEVDVRGTFGPGSPSFSSGIVDIATTSLAEIRSVVMTADAWPGQPPAGATGPAAGVQFFDPILPTPNATPNSFPDTQNQGVDGQFTQWRPAATGGDPDVLGRMQSWMEDGLPSWSHATDPDDRVRVRYEPAAPNYLEVLRTPATTPGQRLQQSWERTDQVMLSSSNFLPRCTEFIVEWSFGKAYPSDPTDPNYVAGRAGEPIWHGMARRADGTPTNLNDQQAVVKPYTWDANGGGDPRCRYRLRYRQIDGDVANVPQFVNAQIVHGQQTGVPFQPLSGEPVTSYFGYVDPTFDPDTNDNGRLDDPDDAASATLPWAWPKLVRVTLGLSDPNDPTIEQRFQFVFELPPTPEP